MVQGEPIPYRLTRAHITAVSSTNLFVLSHMRSGDVFKGTFAIEAKRWRCSGNINIYASRQRFSSQKCDSSPFALLEMIAALLEWTRECVSWGIAGCFSSSSTPSVPWRGS